MFNVNLEIRAFRMLANNNISRFVIQQHWHRDRETHYDLMLQFADVLKTWRIMTNPADIAQNQVKAEKIFDHPPKFLDYQGTVNNGLGLVKIADSGTYELIKKTDSYIEVNFIGKKLRGKYALTKDQGNNSWWVLSAVKKQ
jgi:bifunctional non-homologous end joining protein LigD